MPPATSTTSSAEPSAAPLFRKPEDDDAFERVLREALDFQPTRLLAYRLRRPAGWAELVNAPQSEAEVAALRRCVAKGLPFGGASWVAKTAGRLGLESSLRERGRPRKQTEV